MAHYSPALYQFEIFMVALLIGKAIGISIDFYRVLRNYYAPGLRVTFFVDFIFWCILTAVIMAVIMFKLWGQMYFFSYLGLASGYLIYTYLFSRHVILFWLRLSRLIFRLVKKWGHVLKVGGGLPLKAVGQISGSVSNFCRSFFRK